MRAVTRRVEYVDLVSFQPLSTETPRQRLSFANAGEEFLGVDGHGPDIRRCEVPAESVDLRADDAACDCLAGGHSRITDPNEFAASLQGHPPSVVAGQQGLPGNAVESGRSHIQQKGAVTSTQDGQPLANGIVDRSLGGENTGRAQVLGHGMTGCRGGSFDTRQVWSKAQFRSDHFDPAQHLQDPQAVTIGGQHD